MSEEFIYDGGYPLLEDKIYEAQCVKYDDKFVFGKTRKLFLIMKIIELGPYLGQKVFMAFNMPNNGKIRTGSKYYKTWVFVNGWTKPSRNAKMSPKLFMNKIFKIKLRTVKPKSNNKIMPEEHWYSVVDYIKEVIAG